MQFTKTEILFEPEAECSLCAYWPHEEREELRQMIEENPISDPLCELCFRAFCRNMGWPIDGTKH